MTVLFALLALVLYIFGCILVSELASGDETRLDRAVGTLLWPVAVLWGLLAVLWEAFCSLQRPSA